MEDIRIFKYPMILKIDRWISIVIDGLVILFLYKFNALFMGYFILLFIFIQLIFAVQTIYRATLTTQG